MTRFVAIPASTAIASAVAELSPVSIQTSRPRVRNASTAATDVGFKVSATPNTAAGWPSMPTKTAVRPRREIEAASESNASTEMPYEAR